MAAYMPQPQVPANPHQDFSPNTPPDQAMFQMNSAAQRGGYVPMPNGTRQTHRISVEYRGSGLPHGSKAIPTGPQTHTVSAASRNFGPQNGGAFDGPRSPPNAKSTCPKGVPGVALTDALPLDTSHVPCKFFKVGQCQAGKACPFSHSTDTSKFETPCKYFAKVCDSPLLLYWRQCIVW